MLRYIFVHGLNGWGTYDSRYEKMPYWGMRGGDVIRFLKDKGFDCYAPSVDPHGSAWDRACELYAQLAGTRTDYGKVHSEKYRHERFGRDFSECPLMEDRDEDVKLVLIGHSFGGATVRMFSQILIEGCREEIEGTDPEDLSPFFKGGREGTIHTIVTLASPLNGTTAYDMNEDPSFDPKKVRTPLWSGVFAKLMTMSTTIRKDGRSPEDFADYDMHIDHAMEMNRKLSTFENVYYFSLPCSCTEITKKGTHRPKKEMDPFFVKKSIEMGCYTGMTKQGYPVDEAWFENDGLVNTFSAKAPVGAPQKEYDRSHVEPGIWNIFPVYDGDHMAVQGGLVRTRQVRMEYLQLLSMIRDLGE